MMKLKKENLSNFAFIILLALLIFTPVGFQARVFVSRIFSFSPSVLDEEKQLVLSNYDWRLSNADEQVFDFKNLEGKVVLVNLWATWCPPCIAEMPSLKELYADYKDQMQFVFIARDDPKKVRSFLVKKEYNLPVYFEQSSSPDVFAVESIPTTFIISKNGKILIKKTGAANWNSDATRKLLDNLLKE